MLDNPPEPASGRRRACPRRGSSELPPAPILRSEPEEIADGVFVLSDGGVPLVPNVGIVLGTRDVLVVDTGMGIRNGTKVLGHARELAAGRRLLLTVTHFHPEHGLGAQVFVPEATIVYNRAQAGRAPGEGAGLHRPLRELGVDGRRRAGGDRARPPARRLRRRGRSRPRRADGRAAHVGARAHQGRPGRLPAEERILFAGDLVETRLFPIFPYFPPDDVDVDGGAVDRRRSTGCSSSTRRSSSRGTARSAARA